MQTCGVYVCMLYPVQGSRSTAVDLLPCTGYNRFLDQLRVQNICKKKCYPWM